MKQGPSQPTRAWTNHHRATYEAFSYVPGVVASGRFAFLSGQVGFDDDGTAPDEPAAQIRRVFVNLRALPYAVPAEPRNVVDITTHHVGMAATMEPLVEQLATFFGDWRPAWTAVGVTELAVPNLVIELRAVVRVPDAG